MLDVGSAGSHNFAGFRRDIINRARCRVLALVNISCVGLVPSHANHSLFARLAAARSGAFDEFTMGAADAPDHVSEIV